MRRIYSVSIEVYILLVALLCSLGGVLLALLMLRWPVAAGVVLALAVSLLMWVAIYRLVTSGHQVKPVAPVRNAAATVDGVPVEEVTVLR